MKIMDFVIGVIFIGIAIGLIVYNVNSDYQNLTDKTVVIKIDGEIYKAVDLDSNQEIVIENNYGYNLVVINDYEVTMEAADCNDKLCTQMRPISQLGESIVCLPHHLSIEIVGDDSKGGDVDAVAN